MIVTVNHKKMLMMLSFAGVAASLAEVAAVEAWDVVEVEAVVVGDGAQDTQTEVTASSPQLLGSRDQTHLHRISRVKMFNTLAIMTIV
jgi:hypothetical protein